MAQVTTLGLDGGPRFSPLLNIVINDGSARPDVGIVTQLGLGGFSRPSTVFADKAGGTSDTRPDGLFTSLGPAGFSIPPRTFLSKSPARGLAGTVTLNVTAAAALHYGPRHTIVPSLSTSLRPQGVMIFAHRISLAGSNRIDIAVRATLRHVRAGAHYQFSSGTQISITPFGFEKYRAVRSILGRVTSSVTPVSGLHYAPAVARSYSFQASARVSIVPRAAMARAAGGVHYAIQGSMLLELTPRGTVSIVRKTTYSIRGSIQVQINVASTIIKTTGEPQHFNIQGSVTTAVTPNGQAGVRVGIINQYFLSGHNTVTLTPRGRVSPRRAVPLDTDAPAFESQLRTRRRLIRVHR